MFNGIIAVNKPRGMTSHDVVFKLRKIFHTKKVGHTGTLDPEVNGVLPICIGQATRISDYVMNSGKEYNAEIMIGIQTTTEDQTGEVVESRVIPVGQFTEDEVDDALCALTGWIDQTPPMFSAVKVNGRKLYEYARQGQVIDRPSRKVHIISIERTSPLYYAEDGLKFCVKVQCGKGTYIRTLATQIAEQLNTIGHMSLLTRTKSGGFSLEESYSLEQLNEMTDEELNSSLRPIELGLQHLPAVEVDEEVKDKIMNGQKLKQLNSPIEEETVMIYKGRALAIYMPHPEKEGILKARKVFPS